MACVITATCWGQQGKTATDTGALLAQLRSTQRPEREEAFTRLRSDPAAIKDPKVQRALLDLLERENTAIEADNRKSSGPSGATERDAEEGDAEYLAELGETVDSFADWSDHRQVCIFVREAYNPESRFAAKIAAHARIAVPCLLDMSNTDLGVYRAESVAVLVQALSKGRGDIETRYVEAAKQQILRGLHDQDALVRGETVIALGAFGDMNMIPALQEVARSDPGSETRTDNNKQWFPIREEATEAITQIQQRAAQK